MEGEEVDFNDFEMDQMAGEAEDDDVPLDAYENLSDLTLSDESDQSDQEKNHDEPYVARKEQVEIIHLKKYFSELNQEVNSHQLMLDRAREELRKCKEHADCLEDERDAVFKQLNEAEVSGNVVVAERLRAHHRRLCEELENEAGLQKEIQENIDQAENMVAQAEVERGKYTLMMDEVEKRENVWLEQRKQQAEERRTKEDSLVIQSAARKKAQERKRNQILQEKEAQKEHALQEARRSKEKSDKFLRQTMDKLREREQEEEERQKRHLEKRMHTMLSLKRDITMNRDNLKALKARKSAQSKQEESREKQEMEKIVARGGNPKEEMIKMKRLSEFEAMKRDLKNKERENQVEIVNRLYQEEERMKKRKQRQPYLWDDPAASKAKMVKAHRKPKLQVFESYKEGFENTFPEFETPQPPPVQRVPESDDESETRERAADVILPDSDDSLEEENENLAKPEFEGLWQNHKAYKAPKDLDLVASAAQKSKMEKDILNKGLEKQRQSIVIKQIAGGKQFTGQAFYSKPEVIAFKDFDVGKTYKKKVILTNVSYTVNYCKLIGITERLKDFIEILFDPPGQMSAGLTCEMLVTFKPMINEDLEGTVDFMAQTGPFSIPIVCSTKKCNLRLEQNQVDFGVSVIGETLKRTVTLVNDGALGTTFNFYKVTGLKQRSLTTAETSLGRLTTADTMRAVSPVSVTPPIKEKPSKTEKLAKEKPEPAENGIKEKEGETSPQPPEEEGVKEKKEVKIDGDTLDDTGELIDPLGNLSPPAEMEELSSLDGMVVGQVLSGEIGPHSSVKLDIVWAPTIPINVHAEFIVGFADPLSENMSVEAVGRAVDVPVWVERQDIDLKICMYDRLYQDTVLIHNRATTALRLRFEVGPELRNHLELLPKTGYIQAQSTFSAQLKFLPRSSLAEEAGKYFDPETGVLQAPLIITVADQTRPVPFRVHAVVTTSDLELSASQINFGSCTIYEAVKTTIQLTNKSILPQKFGFLGIPQFVDIQPNDGFGTLLPLETIELDLIFKPEKAEDYKFELICRSLINREFKLKCQGTGVLPPLELSHQIVHFKATALNDVSMAAIHIINNHTSTNEFTHPVPRIGKGEIAPVGPTSFEFVIPEGAPLTVSPSVGTIMPGHKSRIQLRFSPRLEENEIKQEAARIATKLLEAKALREYEEAVAKEKEAQETAQRELSAAYSTAKGKKGAPSTKGKPSPKQPKKVDSQPSVSLKGPAPVKAITEDQIQKDGDDYSAAQASLFRQFTGDFNSYVIPCYVTFGKCDDSGKTSYRVENTLYLEVHCPAVKPELVVISDSGRNVTNFGDVSIGQSVIKSISLQNISKKKVDLHSSILDTAGPFQMLNALRLLPPDASHSILVCFTPHKGQVFQEVLDLDTGTSTLSMTLKGTGVSPVIQLSVGNVFDVGPVIAGEYREESFKIENTSTLAVHYSIKLDSQSLVHFTKAQQIPDYLTSNKKGENFVGPQNFNGQNVFDCVPANGVIPAGSSQEVVMTFAPDHCSDFFSDGVRLELFGQDEVKSFQVVGQAKSHIMYISGGDALHAPVQSLAVLPPRLDSDGEVKPGPNTLLVSLYSVAAEDSFSTASKKITIGCVRTMAVSQKKNGEWSFDNPGPLANLGISVDPLKGMLEAGTEKPVTITWSPQPGHDGSKPLETAINVTLTGDMKETFSVLIHGYVVTE